MRKTVLGLVVVLLAIVASAFAQDKNANFGRVFVIVPKPGMSKQFEEGRKRHMDWHRKQNDTWSWETWQAETGPNGGSYLSITFGHTWKDFDTWDAKLGAADDADGAANMTPYQAGGESSIWMYMPEVSHAPAGAGPSKLAEVTHFFLNPGGEDDFNADIAKINDAITKSNWGSRYFWYTLINGGEGPHYVLVVAHDNWADFAEPDPPFPAMLEKALGKHDADALMQSVYKNIRKETSEVLRFRPDLSYMPGK